MWRQSGSLQIVLFAVTGFPIIFFSPFLTCCSLDLSVNSPNQTSLLRTFLCTPLVLLPNLKLSEVIGIDKQDVVIFNIYICDLQMHFFLIVVVFTLAHTISKLLDEPFTAKTRPLICVPNV